MVSVSHLQKWSRPKTGDCVIACRVASAAGKAVLRLLGRQRLNLPANAYRIETISTGGGKVLLVLGGDLFGLLAGLSDALTWSELSRSGLVYRGGDKTEKPAFPLRYYWTWDHSTNWVLDDPGNQVTR